MSIFRPILSMFVLGREYLPFSLSFSSRFSDLPLKFPIPFVD